MIMQNTNLISFPSRDVYFLEFIIFPAFFWIQIEVYNEDINDKYLNFSKLCNNPNPAHMQI